MGSAECGVLLFRIRIYSLLSLLPPVQIYCVETPKLLLSRPLGMSLGFLRYPPLTRPPVEYREQ